MSLMANVISKYEREAQQRIKEVREKNRDKVNEREELFWKPPVRKDPEPLTIIPQTMKPPKSIWDAKPINQEVIVEAPVQQHIPQPRSTVVSTSSDVDGMRQRVLEIEKALDELKCQLNSIQ